MNASSEDLVEGARRRRVRALVDIGLRYRPQGVPAVDADAVCRGQVHALGKAIRTGLIGRRQPQPSGQNEHTFYPPRK